MLKTLRERALFRSALFGIVALISGCAIQGRAAPGRRAFMPAQGSLRIADADFDREPSPVDERGALADLDVALHVFEEAYAGLDGQPRLPDAAKIAALRKRLASRERWMPAELAEALFALFGRPDGHLAFGYGGRSPLRLTAFPTPNAAATPSPINGSAAAAPSLINGSAAAAPSLINGSAAGPASFARPVAEAGLDPRAPSSAAIRFTQGSVPVLAIRTFDSAAESALRLLPEIAARLREERAFVVDLRGNRGGNFAFAEAFVLALTDRPLRRLDEREVRSVAAALGRENSARRRIALGEVPEGATRAFQDHIAALSAEARALRDAGAGRTEIITRDAIVRGRAPGPLKGRAVFLVDRGCASACEMMLALARQIPGVTLAGENTFGGMAVGEVALFRLPASGVTISLGTRAFTDPLGDFRETSGFTPDVRLEGNDPVAEARYLASSAGGVMASARASFRR
jgi:hypothetical protein